MRRRVYTRLQAEAEFIHALTRQVGYTAGAFSVQRMAGIVSHFVDANAYQFELVKRLTSVASMGEPLTEKYAGDVLNFAAELGIISKLPGASAPHLSRYVLSDAGVAIRAARAVSPELESLILADLILANDADAYLRVLALLRKEDSASAEEHANEFRELIVATRESRFRWLERAFPSKPVMMRLVKSGPAQVHWLKVQKLGIVQPEKPKADFGRHHFAPRKSWATELGHFDATEKRLTSSGLRLMELAKWSNERPSQHWISPSDECLEFLRVPAELRTELVGATVPTLDLFRPAGEEQEPTADLINVAADFLRVAFNHIRLVHARQALTSPLKYFVVAHEQACGFRVDLELLLQAISRNFPKEFSFFSSRSGALAYYQLRKGANG